MNEAYWYLQFTFEMHQNIRCIDGCLAKNVIKQRQQSVNNDRIQVMGKFSQLFCVLERVHNKIKCCWWGWEMPGFCYANSPLREYWAVQNQPVGKLWPFEGGCDQRLKKGQSHSGSLSQMILAGRWSRKSLFSPVFPESSITMSPCRLTLYSFKCLSSVCPMALGQGGRGHLKFLFQ